VQRFVGLVNYVGNFLPNITAFTGPLLAITKNGSPFFWQPIHEKCFEMIKAICCKTPVLKPLDYEFNEPIWMICDMSSTSVGAMYGQGPDWWTCRPARFMSKKFSSVQQHYAVHEMETLAILEALQKWEDKVIEKHIHIIMDHKALEFFKTQNKLSPRQLRWTNYMSKFDFDITYIKGEYNKVADTLSRYYENNTPADLHDFHEFVHTDQKLDPDSEDLPHERIMEVKERVVEIRAMQGMKSRKERILLDGKELQEIEAEELRHTNEHPNGTQGPQGDITLGDSLGKTPNITTPLRYEGSKEDIRILNWIWNGYKADKLFKFIIETLEKYPSFTRKDGLLHKANLLKEEVICIPRDRELVTDIPIRCPQHYGALR
jgi:hypothetical protein